MPLPRRYPKDSSKAFLRNIVDASALRDIRDASAYDNYALLLYIKQYYSVEAAVHQRIVRVRSSTDRRIRTLLCADLESFKSSLICSIC